MKTALIFMAVIAGCSAADDLGGGKLNGTSTNNDADASTSSGQDGGTTSTQPSPDGSTTVTPLVGGAFVPVTPIRIFDSRDGSGMGTRPAAGKIPGGLTEVRLGLGGLAGSPLGSDTDRLGIVANIVVANAFSSGYLQAYPCGSAAPPTVVLNFPAGEVVANLATIGTGSDICIRSSTSTDIIVDVQGTYRGDRSGGLNLIKPVRLIDTRAGGGSKTLDAETKSTLIPGTATAALVRVVIVDPDSNGFASVKRCDQLLDTSSINYKQGQTVANQAMVEFDPGVGICVSSLANAHIVLDLEGYTMPGSGLRLMNETPKRIYDSREVAILTAGQPTTVPVAADGRKAAVMNVAVTGSALPGFLSVFPCGTPSDGTSMLNFGAGDTRSAHVVSQTDAAGNVCVSSNVAAHVVFDLTGALR